MTTIHVDGAGVARLAVAMRDAAGRLAVLPAAVDDASSVLGPGPAAAVLTDVLTGWQHQRLAVGRDLEALADRVVTAGEAYIEVEAAATSLVGGSW